MRELRTPAARRVADRLALGVPVAALGLGVLLVAAHAFGQVPQSPATLVDGTKVCGASASVIATVGAGYAIRLQNQDAAETVKYGDATPVLTLGPGAETSFDVSDLTTIYCQRAGSSDVTITYGVLQ